MTFPFGESQPLSPYNHHCNFRHFRLYIKSPDRVPFFYFQNKRENEFFSKKKKGETRAVCSPNKLCIFPVMLAAGVAARLARCPLHAPPLRCVGFHRQVVQLFGRRPGTN